MTVTDVIYSELMNGIKTGLDYDQIRLKWEKSKGPFYNALQMVFANAGVELMNLQTEQKGWQERKVAAKNNLARLKTEYKSVETQIDDKKKVCKSWEQKASLAKGQAEKLDAELGAKAELLDRVLELQKIGFQTKDLQHLHDVLVEVGSKRGLKPKEAIASFFADLKDYDTKSGFANELTRITAIATTEKLEAKKWQAEKEDLARKYRGIKEAVCATESLLKQGIKPEQIVSWNKIVAAIGGIDELSRDVSQYKTLKETIAVQNKALQNLNLKKEHLEGEITTLNEQKSGIEGAIEILSHQGTERIAAAENEALSEIRALVKELRDEVKFIGEAKAEAGALKRELSYAKYFTSNNDEALEVAGKGLPDACLGIVAKWCRLKNVYCKTKAPHSVQSRYYGISSYEEVALPDLITWAQSGLAEYHDERSQRLVYKAVRNTPSN
jgi:predicted  nucleic acid-binding Zn-ribbon protein